MDIHDWQKKLWNYITEELYIPHKPLYLTFHQKILETIYQKAKQSSNIAENEAIDCFNQECNRYLSPSYKSIYLDKKIWERDERGLSLAVCYAVQQILAVEDMEARTFYEPYITIMGATDKMSSKNLHKNPLGNNFEKIWGTIKYELQIFLSCEQSQITFNRGIGKNKLRNYPFSQSLLSEVELCDLSKRFPLKKTKTEENAKKCILRNEGVLKKRSRKKLFNHEFMERISKQLSAYLNYYREGDINPNSLTSKHMYAEEKNIIEIICISEGFGPDSYELISRGNDSTIQIITSLHQIEKSFTNGFSLFLSSSAGQWVASSIYGKYISDFRSMILGINQKKSLRLVEVIASKLGIESVRVDLSNRIQGAEDFVFYEIPFYGLDFKELSLEKMFFDGDIYLDDETSAKIEFDGGLVVNSLKKRYLVNYPPTEIKYLNNRLSHNETVEVIEDNITINITISKLFSKFREVQSECNFHVRYRNSSITIGFEESKFELDLEIPVNFIVNEQLKLSKRSLEQLEPEPYFSHFLITNYKFKRSVQLNSNSLIKYLHMPRENWIPLPDNENIIGVLAEVLNTCEFSFLIQIFVHEIFSRKKIPYPLLLDVVDGQGNASKSG